MGKHETPQDRYHKAHTVSLTIRLMKNTEQDILQKLDSVPNKERAGQCHSIASSYKRLYVILYSLFILFCAFGRYGSGRDFHANTL